MDEQTREKGRRTESSFVNLNEKGGPHERKLEPLCFEVLGVLVCKPLSGT